MSESDIFNQMPEWEHGMTNTSSRECNAAYTWPIKEHEGLTNGSCPCVKPPGHEPPHMCEHDVDWGYPPLHGTPQELPDCTGCVGGDPTDTGRTHSAGTKQHPPQEPVRRGQRVWPPAGDTANDPEPRSASPPPAEGKWYSTGRHPELIQAHITRADGTRLRTVADILSHLNALQTALKEAQERAEEAEERVANIQQDAEDELKGVYARAEAAEARANRLSDASSIAEHARLAAEADAAALRSKAELADEARPLMEALAERVAKLPFAGPDHPDSTWEAAEAYFRAARPGGFRYEGSWIERYDALTTKEGGA